MLSSILAVAAALLTTLPPACAIPQAGSGSSTAATAACNNSPLLCNREYNSITHMGAHNSAFLRDESTGFSASGNQFYNATTALSAGIRLLQAQVHDFNDTLELCHTSCSLLDGGPLETFLSDVKGWMDANPNEVVTIILVNSDNKPAASFGSIFASSGISAYGYTPPFTTSPMATWPTLQTLITANTRLVTFIASIEYDTAFPYLLSEFDHVFETPFEVISLSGFNCTLDRPSSLPSPANAVSAGFMGLLNHFADTPQAFGLVIPNVDNITTTNSPSTGTTGALGLHAQNCALEWGVRPTFMLVDFWNVGPSVATADRINGVAAVGRVRVSTAQMAISSSDGVRARGSVGRAWGLLWLLLRLGILLGCDI